MEAAAIEARLKPLGTAARAGGSKAYLKSTLRFLGNDTPTLRAEARRCGDAKCSNFVSSR